MYWEMEKGKIVSVQYLEGLRLCEKNKIICLHGKAILRAKIAPYLALFYQTTVSSPFLPHLPNADAGVTSLPFSPW